MYFVVGEACILVSILLGFNKNRWSLCWTNTVVHYQQHKVAKGGNFMNCYLQNFLALQLTTMTMSLDIYIADIL